MDQEAVELLEAINESDESDEVKDLLSKTIHRASDAKERYPDADPSELSFTVSVTAQDAGALLALIEAFGNVFDVPENVVLAGLRLNLAFIDGAVYTLDHQ
jgi:hypothetical protein